MFFNNSKSVLDHSHILLEKIFNLGKTVISTVQKLRQVFTFTESKQVGKVTSGERGENVTMCACVSAIGHALPPPFVFPRVHFREHILKEAPNVSLGLSCSSDWMNSKLFPKVLLHFLKYMNVSRQHPGLLFLDNHQSHIGLGVIIIAQENGLTLMTFFLIAAIGCNHWMCVF